LGGMARIYGCQCCRRRRPWRGPELTAATPVAIGATCIIREEGEKPERERLTCEALL
jgi:hypothetical protein